MKTTLPLLALLSLACTPSIPQIELPGNDLGAPSAGDSYPTALRYTSTGALWLGADGSRAFRWDGAHWSEPGAPQFGLSSANNASLMRHGDQVAALVHTQEGASPRLRIFDGTDWSDLELPATGALFAAVNDAAGRLLIAIRGEQSAQLYRESVGGWEPLGEAPQPPNLTLVSEAPEPMALIASYANGPPTLTLQRWTGTEWTAVASELIEVLPWNAQATPDGRVFFLQNRFVDGKTTHLLHEWSAAGPLQHRLEALSGGNPRSPPFASSLALGSDGVAYVAMVEEKPGAFRIAAFGGGGWHDLGWFSGRPDPSLVPHVLLAASADSDLGVAWLELNEGPYNFLPPPPPDLFVTELKLSNQFGGE